MSQPNNQEVMLGAAKVAVVVGVGWLVWMQVEDKRRVQRRMAVAVRADKKAKALKEASVMQKNAAATLEATRQATPGALQQKQLADASDRARLEALKLAFYAQQSLNDAVFSRKAAKGVPFAGENVCQ